MMTLLAGAFTALSGGWVLRLVTIPLIGLLSLTGFHLMVESWKNNLRAAGAAQCDVRWERQIRADEAKVLGIERGTAEKIRLTDQQQMEALQHELESVQQKYDGLRVGTDSKCLSDSVLDRMGGSGSVPLLGRSVSAGGQAGVPQPRQARPAKPAGTHD